MNYKMNKRQVPHWYKWTLWSLVIFYIARRFSSLIFLLVNSSYLLKASSFYGEICMILVCILGIIGEIITNFNKRISITRGFWVMTMWNIIISYGSWYYYPRNIAMMPAGASAYVFNVLTSTWYIHTWIVSLASSIIGLILTTYFTEMAGLTIGIFKKIFFNS